MFKYGQAVRRRKERFEGEAPKMWGFIELFTPMEAMPS